MKINESDNVGLSVSRVLMMARTMQSKSASGWNTGAVYEIATNIMIECQKIKQLIQDNAKE